VLIVATDSEPFAGVTTAEQSEVEPRNPRQHTVGFVALLELRATLTFQKSTKSIPPYISKRELRV
jgi:hypothetical protein